MSGPRGGSGPPGKSQVAVCFLRNTGTNTSRKAIGPLWVKWLLNRGSYSPL